MYEKGLKRSWNVLNLLSWFLHIPWEIKKKKREIILAKRNKFYTKITLFSDRKKCRKMQIKTMLSCSTNGMTHFTLLSLSLCLSPGRSPSMQLGSHSDSHVDVAADRQFGGVPRPCGSGDVPRTQPALPQPTGGCERRRQGEHWRVTYGTELYQYCISTVNWTKHTCIFTLNIFKSL